MRFTGRVITLKRFSSDLTLDRNAIQETRALPTRQLLPETLARDDDGKAWKASIAAMMIFSSNDVPKQSTHLKIDLSAIWQDTPWRAAQSGSCSISAKELQATLPCFLILDLCFQLNFVVFEPDITQGTELTLFDKARTTS